MSADETAPDLAALTEREEQEYAVHVAALLAGRIDGQQAVAGLVAVTERIIAAHVEAARREAARAALAEVERRIEALPTTRTQAWATGWDSISLNDALTIVRAYAAEVAATATTEGHAVIDAAHIEHQRAWSTATFGPRELRGPTGPLAHIRKELDEVAEDPSALEEWVDVIILAFDGAWRAGHEPQAILDAIKAKQAKNEAREWPDWRGVPADQAIEHLRITSPTQQGGGG